MRVRDSRCFAYEEQLRDYYLNLYKDIWNWLWSHRFWCFNAAVIYALLQPLAILNSPVAAQTVSPVNPLLQPVSLVQPLQDTAPPEVDKVPDLPPPAPVAPVNSAPSGCGDNFYANFIYSHESGCNTAAINPIGACGIGQAWPCSKLGCSLSDYACQNAYFTQYAYNTYGSWEAAYSFWVAHSWW